MGRLIDAERLKAHYCWWAGGSKEMSIDEAKKTFDTIIDIQPTVEQPQTNATENMVEIVRCKDCRYWDTNGYGAEYNNEGYGWCEEIAEFDTKKDWYCGWGERKEDAKTN